jgi:hypothetical protein
MAQQQHHKVMHCICSKMVHAAYTQALLGLLEHCLGLADTFHFQYWIACRDMQVQHCTYSNATHQDIVS